MFMQFIDEWYDETQPFAFFKSNDKARARGMEKFTKEKEVYGSGKAKFQDQNQLEQIKTTKELKTLLETGDSRKKYMQNCGKETYNKKAK